MEGLGESHLTVRDGSRTFVVAYDDIIWFEAEDYYVRIHTRRERLLVRLSLKRLAHELDGARFARVHRSAIVNLAWVREVEHIASGDGRVVLNDGTELRVSRTYRPVLHQRLGRS